MSEIVGKVIMKIGGSFPTKVTISEGLTEITSSKLDVNVFKDEYSIGLEYSAYGVKAQEVLKEVLDLLKDFVVVTHHEQNLEDEVVKGYVEVALAYSK